MSSFTFDAGALTPVVTDAARALHARGFSRKLFERDPSAWSSDPAVQQKIANRLGWLTAPGAMRGEVARLRQFAAAARDAGTTDVVLLGMGGSSLAPEVLRAVAGVQPGFPRFTMVDTVNPERVGSIAPDLARTLFVLASKSGSTIEPNVLAAHFRQRLLNAGLPWATHFVAITDPGTALHSHAHQEGFGEIFVNPPDIGGRYSAVSLFGLVPAALMGLDPAAIVEDAAGMLDRARGERDLLANEALALGVLMGAAAAQGRDKLTLVLPKPLAAFGLWVEQLVAESTGKQGRGIVPITGEPLGRAAHYGTDRVMVRVRLADYTDEIEERATYVLADLQGAAMPVAEITLSARSALGAEFVRWELATAAAAAVLGINPFDEPNVQQAKDATRRLLDEYVATGRLADVRADAEIAGARVALTSAARAALAGRPASAALSLLGEGDYCALLAYLPESPAIDDAVSGHRASVRAATECATTFGYGPRYLHSTGQLHKGGSNNGVFVLVTAPGPTVPIPGERFDFGTLERAQALGDFASLEETGRRAIHVDLPHGDAAALRDVLSALEER